MAEKNKNNVFTVQVNVFFETLTSVHHLFLMPKVSKNQKTSKAEIFIFHKFKALLLLKLAFA